MTRTTIDFGIDLGTTNSAIAVLKKVTPEIIKSSLGDVDVTPSAVGYGKNGQLFVGNGGLSKYIAARVEPTTGTLIENGFIEFKRRMGVEYVYKFTDSGLNRKPEELSAEVLKQLKADVAARTGEDVTVQSSLSRRHLNCTSAMQRGRRRSWRD